MMIFMVFGPLGPIISVFGPSMLDRNAGIRGFPKLGVPFWEFQTKDKTILGSILGAYYCTLGNYQLPLYRITVLCRGLLSESGGLSQHVSAL